MAKAQKGIKTAKSFRTNMNQRRKGRRFADVKGCVRD